MPRFLSDAWLAEMNAAVASARPAAPSSDDGPELVLEQVVTNAPAGEVRYTLVFDDGGVRVSPTCERHADATFTEDYETAVAIHRGDLTPQQAFMTGRIRVAGNLAALMANQEALAALDPALASLRQETTY